MKRYVFFLFLAVCVFAGFQQVLQSAEITYIKGSVQVKSPLSQWNNAQVGMQLDINDSVRTARRSQADIALDKEKNNFIRLEEQTLIILNSTTPGEINRFDLSNGEIYANIEQASP